MRERIFQHSNALKSGRHHSPKLQKSYNKHGSQFQCGVIERCSPESLTEREQFWINFFNSFAVGYNSRPKAESCLGKLVSDETKIKLSESNKKTWANQNLRSLLSERFKGVVRGKSTPESNQKRSTASRKYWKTNPHLAAEKAKLFQSPEVLKKRIASSNKSEKVLAQRKKSGAILAKHWEQNRESMSRNISRTWKLKYSEGFGAWLWIHTDKAAKLKASGMSFRKIATLLNSNHPTVSLSIRSRHYQPTS